MSRIRWYEDSELVSNLPRRYQAYATYSRIAGHADSRRITGGSFLLRLIRRISALANKSTIARVRGVDGLVVVTDFADERVLEVIHEIREENPESKVMKALLREGATFIDVGANFGTFSLLASRLVGKSGRVIAIEPQPGLAAMIGESFMLSGVTNARVEQIGLGKSAATRTLLIPRDDSGRAGFYHGFSGKAGHEVVVASVFPLDGVVDYEPQDAVIKIDAEGSELEILEGASMFIRASMPAIIIELNPWSLSASGTSPARVLERLVEFGYSSFTTAELFPEQVAVSQLPMTRQFNLVAQFGNG